MAYEGFACCGPFPAAAVESEISGAVWVGLRKIAGMCFDGFGFWLYNTCKSLLRVCIWTKVPTYSPSLSYHAENVKRVHCSYAHIPPRSRITTSSRHPAETALYHHHFTNTNTIAMIPAAKASTFIHYCLHVRTQVYINIQKPI